MLNESNISNATYELPEELEIIEGWCGGSNIDIYPIKDNEEKFVSWDDPYNERLRKYGISIDEDGFADTVEFFLERYFDANLIWNINNHVNCDGTSYEHYGENYYTYKTLNEILNSIERTIFLLETNIESPELDSYFNNFHFKHYDEHPSKDPRKIKDYVEFYKFFITRMRKMMSAVSESEIICFSGP